MLLSAMRYPGIRFSKKAGNLCVGYGAKSKDFKHQYVGIGQILRYKYYSLPGLEMGDSVPRYENHGDFWGIPMVKKQKEQKILPQRNIDEAI